MKNIKNKSDNLIYNRFDLIHPEQFQTGDYDFEGSNYEIMSYTSGGIRSFNIWGRELPQELFESIIYETFQDDGIYAVQIKRGRNQYKNLLEEVNDICVPLPDTFDELMNRAERRDRATIRRKLRWLDERIGSLKVDTYERKDVPSSIVETYFDWKKETHGTDYGLSSEEYLDKYYVTDVVTMRAGDTDVAVAFFCQVEDIVFFENFSYNRKLQEYSPGLLMYVKFLEELVRRECRFLYLGGGSYVYKKRFGAEESVAYSGIIYRREIVELINVFLGSKV